MKAPTKTPRQVAAEKLERDLTPGPDPFVDQLALRLVAGERWHEVLPSAGTSGGKTLERLAQLLAERIQT